ncbi:polysaccharide biosynthesis protein [Formosa agariphila KMM 3901]|uniref:Polysaccharide biosynthesis protein n=1 Tax=Formosa agariphila (strain DSM 15362 / KCTC 12365 / LMG 23005 / KMM 3901 / M-2Alg 35-1) TaxID=1347342 RepID=T2KRP2_FORAG|nr:oligosaccharide flippase family protein [Formosa agariphila]CDF81188.1 polysaccharide biosynthesis protein [Formosa agariphila KMM 3901]
MSSLQRLFKQTFIYGLATVLPRMLNFFLVPLYTSPGVLNSVAEYGTVSVIFSWFVIFNVVLAYGMETAFFRFFNKEKNQDEVVGTSTISLILSSLGFFALALIFQNQIAYITEIKVEYIKLVIWILLLDALVIIPFAWLRANEKSMTYAIIKIINVAINLGLNLFFLLALNDWSYHVEILDSICRENYQINYIFIANLIASAVTLLLLLSFYVKVKYNFNTDLWKRMMRYAFPVLIAGLAFSVNETFDRILLSKLLPESIADTQVGMYSACYKLALFMTLFATAYRLGIEPFFFSHAKTENPQKNYAKILEFFVTIGSLILLGVIVFADLLKVIVIRSEDYWEAMSVVPIILLAYLFLGMYHNLSVWYKITDRTKFGAYISIFGAVVTLVLNFWLIPIISYRGSAIATLAAYGSMVLLSYYFGRKYYPIPYNIKKISAYILVSVTFSIISFYFFRENYVVGIGLLSVYMLIIYKFEKQDIQSLLKR